MELEKYKSALKEKKMTYEDLATATNLSLGCIKRIMAGIAKYPRVDTIEAIERALGLYNSKNVSETISEEERELLAMYAEMTEQQKKYLRIYAAGLLKKDISKTNWQ